MPFDFNQLWRSVWLTQWLVFCRRNNAILLDVHLANEQRDTECLGSHWKDQIHIKRSIHCPNRDTWSSFGVLQTGREYFWWWRQTASSTGRWKFHYLPLHWNLPVQTPLSIHVLCGKFLPLPMARGDLCCHSWRKKNCLSLHPQHTHTHIENIIPGQLPKFWELLFSEKQKKTLFCPKLKLAPQFLRLFDLGVPVS